MMLQIDKELQKMHCHSSFLQIALSHLQPVLDFKKDLSASFKLGKLAYRVTAQDFSPSGNNNLIFIKYVCLIILDLEL